MAHFAPNMTYIDATLGWSWYKWQDLYDLYARIMPTWPSTAASYPTRILGDATRALVSFTDTPELFGHEIRALAAVSLRHGKIVRWVDYWDGRAFTMSDIQQQRTPQDQFPTDFAFAVGTASPTFRAVAERLGKALNAGSAEQATTLFHPDAVLEDLALHTTTTGRHSIASFLASALPSLPYGRGVMLRHVVGHRRGGGFEWVNPASAAPRGITALELDGHGLVTRMTSVWDGSLWPADAIGALQAATILQ
ncbi:hypothetical protein ACGFWD_27200 [Streptomyces sp. NPDC048448]|uniref:hypothetical protein n=1 Tax=Streptomyces sp. NPDC048448 TaxID=3365554 RepID=UPI0037209323